MRQEVYPADHPAIGVGLHGLAGVLSQLGKHLEATTFRRDAMRIFTAMDADSADVAGMQFDQAKDLWHLPGKANQLEAVQLAQAAKRGFQSAGVGSVDDLARVESWLVQRP